MNPKAPWLLLGAVLALTGSAGILLATEALATKGHERQVFQELVRGFGLGPALDLDPCGLGFDPRICPLCSAQNGAIPGVMWFCPHHAGSIFFYRPMGPFMTEEAGSDALVP
jgi:hypothetical protein